MKWVSLSKMLSKWHADFFLTIQKVMAQLLTVQKLCRFLRRLIQQFAVGTTAASTDS